MKRLTTLKSSEPDRSDQSTDIRNIQNINTAILYELF